MSQFRSGRERHQTPGKDGTQQKGVNHILREDSGCGFLYPEGENGYRRNSVSHSPFR